MLSLFLEKHRGTWGTLFHTSPEFQSLSVAFLIHNHRMSPFPGASNSFSPGATSASWLPSKVCLSPPCSQPPDSYVTVTHAAAVLVEGSSLRLGYFPALRLLETKSETVPASSCVSSDSGAEGIVMGWPNGDGVTCYLCSLLFIISPPHQPSPKLNEEPRIF